MQKSTLVMLDSSISRRRNTNSPIGGWSSDPKMKDIGRWNLLQFTQGVEGFVLFLLKDVLKVSCNSIALEILYPQIF